MVFLVKFLVVVSVLSTTMGFEDEETNSMGVEKHNSYQGTVSTHLEPTYHSDNFGACHNDDMFEAERNKIFDSCLKAAENISSYNSFNYTAGTKGHWRTACLKTGTEVISVTAAGVHAGLSSLKNFRIFINIQDNRIAQVTLQLPVNPTTKYNLHLTTNGQVVTVSFNDVEYIDFPSCQTFEFLVKMPSETFVKCLTFEDRPIFYDNAANFTLKGTNNC